MAEFDRFAEEYEALHRVSIAVTGETPDFFAQYKIAELRSYAAGLAKPVRSILDFGSGISRLQDGDHWIRSGSPLRR